MLHSEPPSTRAPEPPASRAGAPHVAIGASPFHVKGNIYMGTKVFFATKVKGGVEALYAAIEDSALRAFIEQKFLPCALYDVLPAVPLIRAEAKAMALPVRRYLQLRSGYQAEQDLSGIYRFLLKIASAEIVALRLPQLFTQIFDFGRSEASVIAPGHVRGLVADFPVALADWFATSLEVYASTALRLTGARNVVVSPKKIDAGTSETGYALASLQLEFRWSP